jgi:hypothetical protein
MGPSLINFLSQTLIGAIIAIIASWVTVWLSLRRFYSEKWWEKKAEAYAAILEALHYMKRAFDEDFDAMIVGREVPEERKKQLNDKYREAYDELMKRTDVEQYVLSDEAVTELLSFQKAYSKAKDTHDFFDYIEGSLSTINDTMKRMRDIAKVDLKGR